MTPPRNIPTLVRKLKAENDVNTVVNALSDLVGAIYEDKSKATAEIAQAGGIRAVTDLMRQMPQEMRVQGNGCGVLYGLAYEGEKYKREICNAGGIPLVVAAIKNFMNDEISRRNGLRTLKYIAQWSADLITECFPLVYKAVDNFADDEKTQVIGCSIIVDVVVDGTNRATSCRLFADSGGIPIFVSSLKRFIEAASIVAANQQRPQLNIDDSVAPLEVSLECSADILLAFVHTFMNVDAFEEFLNAKGIEAVIDAMRKWDTSIRHHIAGCSLLAHTHSFPNHVKATIGKGGAMEAILQAMILYLSTGNSHDDALVQWLETALYALSALCVSSNDEALIDTLVKKLVECGGIATILLSMEQYPDAVDIQRFACYLLIALSSQAGSPVAVVVDGGRKALERAQSRHASNEDIQKYSKAALESLSTVGDSERCHKCYATGTGLMQCGRCQKVLYCSRDCQREEYDVHKKLCKLSTYQKNKKK